MYVIDNFDNVEDNCPIDVIEVKSGLQIDFDKSEAIKMSSTYNISTYTFP